ncbi:MAG TPA: hypothetical protein VER79_02610 [Candidatus Limnocylindrales bacterium]|nr:hypothetical protein [Candidatus Limnocylindrales bacterium]
MSQSNPEQQRLDDARERSVPWRQWGPYLSERQWGTVREDYSSNGDAWSYFTHDHARSRAYKWGEDGIAGLSDDKQRLCWALALWNGKDPILKERLFGLTNAEGNHGEDVKEYYFYLDSTPTHSYMKMLYKYPQAAFPYDQLVGVNRARGREDYEFELLDTGVFADDRYYDVFVETAKAAPDDVLIQIRVVNHGPEAQTLHVLPHLWFRNTWWMTPDAPRPQLRALPAHQGASVIEAQHDTLGLTYLYAEGGPALLFTENESNHQRLFNTANAFPYVKDGIHNAVVGGQQDTVNPAQTGTKSAAHYVLTIGAGATETIRLRLTQQAPEASFAPFSASYDRAFKARLDEADAFYAALTPGKLTPDQAQIMRQALAGMLWSKQYYFFDLDRWLDERGANPISGGKLRSRNSDWYHMVNDDILSMPDKWEYPWYAAWDLAFHTLALSVVDPDFTRDQLKLMLSEWYLHPNGQMPAYEWNFGDVNPPVHAWATLFNLMVDPNFTSSDELFLKRSFNKLLLNFNWWVNRKDPRGRNVFSGGFLGLDNIGVFDRSAPLPSGGVLEQADGTSWMAFYALNMLELAARIAETDPGYEDFVAKFVEHFMWIAGSMDRTGDNQDELWDEEDGFFYDVLVLPDGSAQRIKVRSMVGLLPLIATTVLDQATVQRFPEVRARVQRFAEKHSEQVANIHPFDKPGVNGRIMLSAVNEDKLRRILARMLDETRFLSPHGLRSLSRYHLDEPYTFEVHGQKFKVQYLPAESDSGMFGGNSNWRGPVWMPVNVLIIRSLLQFYSYYGDDFKVECPTGSGTMMTLYEVVGELTRRLSTIFERDAHGRRPVYGGNETFQTDPNWRDYILFYEYFHGDDGAGLGASHQTGWTGVIARLLQMSGAITSSETVLEEGMKGWVDPGLGDA